MGSPRWTAVCSVLTFTDWLTSDWIVPAWRVSFWPCWHLWHKSRENGSHLWRLVEDRQHVGAHTEGSELRQKVEAQYSVLCPPGCWQHAWRTEHMTAAAAPFKVIVLLLFHLTSECSIIRMRNVFPVNCGLLNDGAHPVLINVCLQHSGTVKPSITELGSKRVEKTQKQSCEWTCEGVSQFLLKQWPPHPGSLTGSSTPKLFIIKHSASFFTKKAVICLDLKGFGIINSGWDKFYFLEVKLCCLVASGALTYPRGNESLALSFWHASVIWSCINKRDFYYISSHGGPVQPWKQTEQRDVIW